MNELNSVWVKIARGEMHYGELRAEIDGFRRGKPYSVISELDPNTGYQIWKVDKEPTPLPEFPSLGDALYNFRSALDHLAHQLVLKAGGKPTTSTEFPIFSDQRGFIARRGQQKIHGMSPAMNLLLPTSTPTK